ncbi:Uu.00g135770.m01.CDS01 [Anthostomella pinea]|uniref:Uu.00g135770.m01.CDS01 n=1 Tax=Anthostomella pinea TaxID=933095 RepID=A0AAI8YKX4_9PEZI|nr:Uu.00g135770.m01.CDS01 [Anthostomella pinea]
MAKQRKATKAAAPAKRKDGGPPAPFKRPAEVLQPIVDTLDEKQVYIIHIDSKPAAFKRKIFVVPVLMNVVIAALLVWRMFHIGPYYLSIFASVLGYSNDTTMVVDEMEWDEIVPEVLRRGFSFTLDFLLFMFVAPWPLDFVFSQENGSPVAWRWAVGFRNREVIVRRSKKWVETMGDVVNDETCKGLFMAHVNVATSPLAIGEKTGYLLMNAEWDLDWVAMVDATTMVDKKMAAIEAFTLVVLLHHEEWGWLCVDMKEEVTGPQDHRRRQVIMFRDALATKGKEDLFYRWIEIIQYESSQPGGFGPEKQEGAAKQIRDMFQKEGIDFDQQWEETVGTAPSVGIQ